MERWDCLGLGFCIWFISGGGLYGGGRGQVVWGNGLFGVVWPWEGGHKILGKDRAMLVELMRLGNGERGLWWEAIG